MIWSAVFLSLAAICWAILSHYNFHNATKNPYSFWGTKSWVRKYKKNQQIEDGYLFILPPDNWYYKIFRIDYKERFPGSATVFVFVTDGYHLVQWFMIKFIVLAITLNVKEFFILYGLWLLFFNLIYTGLKKK